MSKPRFNNARDLEMVDDSYLETDDGETSARDDSEVYKDPTWSFGPLSKPPAASSALVRIGDQAASTMTLEEKVFWLERENEGLKFAMIHSAAERVLQDQNLDPVARANLLNTVGALQPYTLEHEAQKALMAAERAEHIRRLVAIKDEYATTEAQLRLLHLQFESMQNIGNNFESGSSNIGTNFESGSTNYGNNFEAGSQNVTNVHFHLQANATGSDTPQGRASDHGHSPEVEAASQGRKFELPHRPKAQGPPRRPKMQASSPHPKFDRFVKKPKWSEDCTKGKDCKARRTCASTHSDQRSYYGASTIDSLPKWSERNDS